MKVLSLIKFFVLLCCAIAKCSKLSFSKQSLSGFYHPQLSSAFKLIINYWTKLNRTFSIINLDDETELFELFMSDNFINGKVPYKVVNLTDTFKRFDIPSFAIINVESISLLHYFNYRATSDAINIRQTQYFVYCEEANVKNLQTMMEKLSGIRSQIHYFQYFLVEDKKSIKLLTFVWFSSRKCNKPQPVEVNSFDKKKNRWKYLRFEIRKFDNYYGCQLIALINETRRPYAYTRKRDNGSIEYFGLWIDTVKALEKSFNFTVKFTNSMKNYDLSPKFLRLSFKQDHQRLFYFTKPYHLQETHLAVPPGEEYDAYEKLVLPFDFDTWMMIILTFVAAFATIFVVSFMRISARNLLFGDNIDTPGKLGATHLIRNALRALSNYFHRKF
jgi:hypothetical protein